MGRSAKESPEVHELCGKIRKEWFQPFRLDSESLRKLDGALQRHGAKTSYQVLCANDAEWALGIDQLQAIENSPREAICGITIVASADDTSSVVNLELRDFDYPIPNVRLAVSGPRSQITSLSDELTDILAGIRPWYARFVPFVPTRRTSLAVAIFFCVAVFLLWQIEYAAPLKPYVLPLSAVVLSLYGLVAAFGGRTRLFPPGTFALGQGKQRDDDTDRLRTMLLYGLPFGVLASIIAGMILSRSQQLLLRQPTQSP
jgi:hypothetical protein